MEKQKLIVVLLIVAIVISAINLVVNLGTGVSNGDLTPAGGSTAVQQDGGEIGFEILPQGVSG